MIPEARQHSTSIRFRNLAFEADAKEKPSQSCVIEGMPAEPPPHANGRGDTQLYCTETVREAAELKSVAEGSQRCTDGSLTTADLTPNPHYYTEAGKTAPDDEDEGRRDNQTAVATAHLIQQKMIFII